MKQFDLDEYLANPSRKVVTRRGKPVKIHCTNFASDNPVIATMEDDEYSYSFSRDGKFIKDIDESDYDLFFSPEKHEGWVNIYKAGVQKEALGCLVTRYGGSVIYPTEVAAKAAADPDPIATIKIEWEE